MVSNRCAYENHNRIPSAYMYIFLTANEKLMPNIVILPWQFKFGVILLLFYLLIFVFTMDFYLIMCT